LVLEILEGQKRRLQTLSTLVGTSSLGHGWLPTNEPTKIQCWIAHQPTAQVFVRLCFHLPIPPFSSCPFFFLHDSATSLVFGIDSIEKKMQAKTVLITGCGQRGLGDALAKEFRSHGHTVFASALDLDDVDPALAEAGCHVLELDVTSAASIDKAVSLVTTLTRTTTDDEGRLDILINNAGILHIMPFADTPVEHARQVFEVNVLGAWAVTRAFLPLLMAAGRRSGGDAKIGNLCSINEVLCPPFLAAYNASKAALESMGRTMRRELAPLGVQVVALKCGSVETGLFTSDAVAMSGPTCPEGSVYAGLREWIARREFLKSARPAKREVVARELAQELLRENTSAVIWKGGLATVHWLMSFGWETMFVSSHFGSLSLLSTYCSANSYLASLGRLSLVALDATNAMMQDRILIRHNHLDTMSWSPPKA
jgi:NAD(P)-dependent dehydrogenase (short-subunit alcohol dehydrogenase family)